MTYMLAWHYTTVLPSTGKKRATDAEPAGAPAAKKAKGADGSAATAAKPTATPSKAAAKQSNKSTPKVGGLIASTNVVQTIGVTPCGR